MHGMGYKRSRGKPSERWIGRPKPNDDQDWQLSDGGKWYFVRDDGLWEYESGTLWDNVGKKLVRGAPHAIYNSERGREAAIHAADIRKRYIEQGAAEFLAARLGGEKGRKITALSEDVQIAYGKALAEHAFDRFAAGSAQAKRLMAEILQYLPDKTPVELRDAAGNSVSGPADAVQGLVDAMAAEMRRRNGG